MLNQANELIESFQISKGGIASTLVDSRIIFKKALQTKGCCSVILAHNHPSGSVQPSSADKDLTQKIKNGGKLMEISVLDHLIIGDKTYFSFADEGFL
jgi:DNA repair protein RadC